jgi:hypothetical protein
MGYFSGVVVLRCDFEVCDAPGGWWLDMAAVLSEDGRGDEGGEEKKRGEEKRRRREEKRRREQPRLRTSSSPRMETSLGIAASTSRRDYVGYVKLESNRRNLCTTVRKRWMHASFDLQSTSSTYIVQFVCTFLLSSSQMILSFSYRKAMHW